MKTPREVLLARHRAAEPELDRVRERVVRELRRGTHEEGKLGFFTLVWERFRVPRLAWSSLAGAWLVIIALNVASREATQSAPSAPPYATRSPEVLQALREQRLLFAELVGARSGLDPEAPRAIPGPRSERICPTVTA